MTLINIAVTDAGFTRDRLPTILAALQSQALAIYGSDINLDPATPDGQLLAIFAEGIDDTAQAIEDVYNGRNPDVATGQNLRATCRLNGVNWIAGDYAYVDEQMTIKAGAVIPAGTQVQDEDTGAIYASTVDVTGDGSGTQIVTCKALAKGATSAAGKVTNIVKPTYGLTSVTNPAPSSIVDAAETDEQLRIRRNLSTAAPTVGFVDSIVAKLLTVAGVGKIKVWENDQGVVADIKAGDQAKPPHSILVIVTGGPATDIGNAIYDAKPPGITSVGSSSVTVNDSQGIPHTMRYTVATPVEYELQITYRARDGAGFGSPSTGGEDAVKAALFAWSLANQQPSGDVYRYHLAAVAQQAVIGIDGLPAMVIEDIQLCRPSGSLAASDLALAWNEIGSLLTANITMVSL